MTKIARKSRAKRLSVNLPFPGFYESVLSGGLDNEEESFAENEARYRQEEDAIPLELRLEQDDFTSIVFDCMDYRKAHDYLARSYIDGLERVCADNFDLDIKFEYEEMASPREYNFTTDRIFATVALKDIRAMFKVSKVEKHAALARVITRRHSSYDGFWSSYSNDLDTWLEKPLAKWDHNELGTLFRAALERIDAQEAKSLIRTVVYDAMEGDFDQAFNQALDWKKYESKIAELRADKLAELYADDPDYVTPTPRCKHTVDMFTGKVG